MAGDDGFVAWVGLLLGVEGGDDLVGDGVPG